MLPRHCIPLMAIFVAICITSALAAADPAPADELTAEKAYRACFHWLAAGKQSRTERMLEEGVRIFPNDARLLFFAAACERSRFAIAEAAPKFQRVLDADPEPKPEPKPDPTTESPIKPEADPKPVAAQGIYGRAARMMLDMDSRREVGKNFDALRALADEHPDEPLIVWMAGVQCRTLGQPDKGVVYYKRLLELMGEGPGPVLLHQTYANLLDDCGRSDEAMPHRELAVRLEPAPWAYQGMGNTLTRLKRWEEADAAYQKCTDMAPQQEQYWLNWSWSFLERGDGEGAVEKCRRGTELHPQSVTLWNNWGDAERKLGRPREALARYERALELRTVSTRALRGIAEVSRELGEADRAAEMEKRLAAIENDAAKSPVGQ